jgi:flagellin-like hook-associated protein FlgL
MSDITLSTGIRQNLLSLQQTSADLTTTQEALATGDAVNSAAENPSAYFTSQNLTNNANALSSLLDQIGQGQQTINAATNGLTGLTSLLQQALSTAQQAQQAATGTVTYSSITGNNNGFSGLSADTTQSASTYTVANAVGNQGANNITPSVQSTVELDSNAISQLANGDTVTVKLGGGSTVTATYESNGANANNATNKFNTVAQLITILGTGGAGNLGTTATVASDGNGGVKITANDVTDAFTVGGTGISSGDITTPGTDFYATTNTQGSGITLTDGNGNSNTFYYVAANNDGNYDTFTTAAQLATAITNSNVGTSGGGAITASGAGGDLTLSSANGKSIQVGGAIGSALGFGTTAVENNYNEQLSNLASGSTLTVQLGNNAAHTITFGTGNGQVSTKAELQTALSSWTDVNAAFNGNNDIELTPTSTDAITIGGTPASVTALGLSLGATTPTATVVTASSTRATLQNNYNGLLTQMNQLAADSGYNGVNLLNEDNLTLNFNASGTSTLTINGVNDTYTGLGLSSLNNSEFQDNNSINNVVDNINSAIANVQGQTETFGTNSGVITTRQTFETNMINTLQTGASNLVAADQNAESADLLTEQTQQQLEISALSIANQANQSVLKLFG